MEGLTTIQSNRGPVETMERLQALIKAHGMTVFARINHSAMAAEAGMKLAPTDLLLFGNPKGGTPLMQAGQTIGIDLPLKVLIWQDAQGTTWLSYNEPAWLTRRHGINGKEAIAGMLAATLSKIAAQAAQA